MVNNWLQEGLDLLCTYKHNPIIVINSPLNLDGILSYNPFYTFLYNPSIFYALNGGLSAAISYATHPKLQISLFASYG